MPLLARSLALVTLLLASTAVAHAQTPEAAVRAVIDQLFDGMRAGDSTLVRTALHSDARFRTIDETGDAPALREGSAERFVTAVGTPHEQVWDERIWDVVVHIDGAMATAWVPYAFFLGDTFSHCGVNTFVLGDLGDGWRVLSITDTRRREGCDLSKAAR